MPKAGTHSVKGNKSLSTYDPIKDTTGHKPSNSHRGAPKGVTASGNPGRIRAGGSGGGSTPAPALPKEGRDYEAPQSTTRTSR